MGKINLKQLSEAEKAKLLENLQKDKKKQELAEKRAKENYEKLKDRKVRANIRKLKRLSEEMGKVKAQIFADFEDVLAEKQRVYGFSDSQLSHTLTTIDQKETIMIGHNVIDRWDETVDVGISGVNAWLEKIANTDENVAKLAGIIRDLLKPNKAGVLKAGRILDLGKRAEEIGDEELIRAVSIIRDAYRPSRTSTFLKAKVKDEHNNDCWLALSMSDV